MILGNVNKCILLVILLFPALSNAEIQVEAGPTSLSYDWSNGYLFLLSESFGNYNAGFGFFSEQTAQQVTLPGKYSRSTRFDIDIPQNLVVQVERIFRYKKCEVGIGPAYFANTSRVSGTKFNVSLMAGCDITDNFFIRFRHYSNAGTAHPNLGQDQPIMIGWRFK